MLKLTIFMRTNNHYYYFKQIMKAFSGRSTSFEIERQRIDIDDFVCHAEWVHFSLLIKGFYFTLNYATFNFPNNEIERSEEITNWKYVEVDHNLCSFTLQLRFWMVFRPEWFHLLVFLISIHSSRNPSR